MDYIGALESALGTVADKNMLQMQPGDVVDTSADISALYKAIGFKPQTSVKEGLRALCPGIKSFITSKAD